MITQLFNAAIRLKIVPTQWKIADIIMIHKHGKPPHEHTSYRPISLLPVLAKLFEKLLATRLMKIITDNNLFPDHQFGFREKHSTIEQVHRVVDIVNKTFEEKKYCSALFLDVSQAFDKVWHEGLLFKIKMNVPDSMFTILKSYLEERYYRVKHEADTSKIYPIRSGVPQGSVLGPILYLIFTHDIPTNENVTTTTFADDTAMLVTDENPATATESLQRHIRNIEKWTKKWRIKINESKSQHIIFTKCRKISPNIEINNKAIPQAESVKYLGMHLDKTLTWRTHIWKKRQQLNLKFRKHYWILGRTSKLSIRNKLLVYNTILKPVWTYGIQLWGTAAKSNISIMERLQSKVLRSITDAPWFVSNKDIYCDLEVPTISEVIVQCSVRYIKRLESHPNALAINLLDNSQQTHRLKRKNPLDLIYK